MSYDLIIAEDVARFGFSILTISDVTPGFAYTVGLMFTHQHPELIIFGRDPGELSEVLRCMIDGIHRGNSFVNPASYPIKCAAFLERHKTACDHGEAIAAKSRKSRKNNPQAGLTAGFPGNRQCRLR